MQRLSSGYNAKATATNATAQGANSAAKHVNSVALGANTLTDAPNQVAVGNRRVSQVADGRIRQGSTDPVNGGQVWALEQQLDDRWTEVNQRMDGLESAIDAVGAHSGAMAMMTGAGSYLPVGRVAISAGYGQYGSKAAFAVGAKVHLTERTSATLGFSSGASGSSKLMFGAGISYILP